ncbi:MAG: hypothetical protein U1C57_03415, partial [Candidatus Doudnabacteria bacterium]|nr:hypothetical protein [Candidatus Doudnabacteria bacterium]
MGLNHKYDRIWSREYSVQYCECAMRSLGPEVKAHLPALVKDAYYLPERGNEVLYAKSSEWSEWQKALAKVLKNPE